MEHLRNAKAFFEKAGENVNAYSEPVMGGLLNGLSEMCDALADLERTLQDIKGTLRASGSKR